MIKENTVFILGAGASKPYGFPTGANLRNYICKEFPEKYSKLFEGSGHAKFASAENFSDAFFKSSTPSIDLFLSRNPNYSDIGKIAIVMGILEAEEQSVFREDVEEPIFDWYSYLFHRMTKDLILSDGIKGFGANKVSFVTFNYDRSLEHFFMESLVNSFGEAGAVHLSELRKIEIIHVYGKVDQLPWEISDKKTPTPYRGDYSYDMVERMAGNIKTIHEISNQKNEKIERLIASANRNFFLGFGYAEENLHAIGIPKLLDGMQKIYGTAQGLVDKEIQSIRATLSQNFRTKDPALNNPRIKDHDCLMLLRKYL